MRRMNSAEQYYAEAFACAERGKSLEREPGGALHAVEQFQTAVRLLDRLAIVESAAKRELVLDAVRGLRERIEKIEATSDYALARAMHEHEHARAVEDAEASGSASASAESSGSGTAVDAYLLAGDWYVKAYAALSADDAGAKTAVKEQIEYIIEHVSRLKQATMDVAAVVVEPPPMIAPVAIHPSEPHHTSPPPAAAVLTQGHALSSSDAFLQTRMSFSSLDWPEPPPDDLDASLFAEMDELSLSPPPSPQPSPAAVTTLQQQPSQSQQHAASRTPPPPPPPPATAASAKPGAAYTLEELDVLRRSSRINGHVFMPWLDDLDTHEHFECVAATSAPPLQAAALFTDPDGDVPLSAKQIRKRAVWMRPSEFAAECGRTPVMIASVSAQVVKQDIVTDCSFVASLCIAAAYEQRFRKALITNIIYPVDAATRQPVYNPRGKYMVKLWANGVPRKVVIDDRLPVSADSRTLLASCTTRANELWVSLIEKAYLKLNGGYDFPGGNSGIDLFALTGWIPERIAVADDLLLRPRHDSKEERLWTQLQSAFHFGDCIITMSTGDLARDDAKRIGLVPMHVYAVLNVYELPAAATAGTGADSDGKPRRLLQLKNPWRKMSWKGPFSKLDTALWASPVGDELRAYQAQFYPPSTGADGADGVDGDAADNGVDDSDDGLFWIDLESVKRYFESIYLNWNPALFPHRDVCHAHWPLELGPANDVITLGFNPQYSLTFAAAATSARTSSASPKSATVWVLLSRHVREVERDADQATQQFLTLHVYAGARGQRVFFSQRALWRGTYSNNPHTLVSLDVDLTAEPAPSFTLVASQYEKFAPLDFTISVFATSPFAFEAVPQVIADSASSVVIRSAWDARTAGGRPFFSSFMDNPQFHVQITGTGSAAAVPQCRRLYVFLEEASLMAQDAATRSAPVNLRVALHTNERICGVPSASASLSSGSGSGAGPLVLSSGEYRPGFCVVEIGSEQIADLRDLVLVPSTFEPQALSAFTLRVVSDPPHALAMQWREVPTEGAGMERIALRGVWDLATGSAAGCSNYGCYTFNPKFVVHVARECELFVRLLVDRSIGSRGNRGDAGGTAAPGPVPPPAINVSVFESTAEGDLMLSTNPTMAFRGATSEGGVYASGNPSGVATRAVRLPPGWYVVLPSTFEPQQCAFELRVYASVAVDVRSV